MKADAMSLKDIIMDNEPKIFKVPFFQRKYVWKKDEWEELYRSFEDENCDKYLGSLIIKIKTTDKGPCKTYGEIIDGQQRLTTISILTKALYDSIKDEKLKEVIKKNNIYHTIFYTKKSGKTTEDMDSVKPCDLTIKIEHSRLDREDYEKVMNYGIIHKEKPQKSIKKSQEEEMKGIIDCYYYYIEKLSKKDDKYKKNMLDNIYRESNDGDNNERFVFMTLKEQEKREQEIFDTINRAGQTLTHADIVKNDLFKTLMDKFKMEMKEVSKLCDDYWEEVFYNDPIKRGYWDNRERLVNIGEKTHIEILLLFVAIIKISKKDKDLEEQKQFVNSCYDNLSKVYKNYINGINKIDLVKFIKELKIYAELFYAYYRDDVELFNNIRYDDTIKTTLLSMKQCKLKLIFPCILDLLFKAKKERETEELEQLEFNDEDKRVLNALNKYILLNTLCKDIKASTNILAKDILIINNINSINSFYNGTVNEIKNSISESINKISNQIAKIVLFNLEISKTNEFDAIDTFNYDSLELEHIMPIKWKKYWAKGIGTTEKENKRNEYIFKIGNMILLKDKMNRKIQNASFEDKMNGKIAGKKKIPGYKDYAMSFKTSRDIVDDYKKKKYKWDESRIESRTTKLENEIKEYFKLSVKNA